MIMSRAKTPRSRRLIALPCCLLGVLSVLARAGLGCGRRPRWVIRAIRCFYVLIWPQPKPREEAVQGAGMSGPVQAQGAAESDASVHLRVRSHVPGRIRDRVQAEEAGIKKAKPQIETPSAGIRLWAVSQRGSAHEPPPENPGSGRDVVGMLDSRQVRAYIYAPEPPLCACLRVWR
jgi:hypothetical protein